MNMIRVKQFIDLHGKGGGIKRNDLPSVNLKRRHRDYYSSVQLCFMRKY